MDKIIIRDLSTSFEFKGPVITLIAYNEDGELIDYCVLKENK